MKNNFFASFLFVGWRMGERMPYMIVLHFLFAVKSKKRERHPIRVCVSEGEFNSCSFASEFRHKRISVVWRGVMGINLNVCVEFPVKVGWQQSLKLNFSSILFFLADEIYEIMKKLLIDLRNFIKSSLKDARNYLSFSIVGNLSFRCVWIT